MEQRTYRSGQFARKASVSVRTLRYYDRVGLLHPSCSTEAGYRLYTDADLPRLQQILALKFLGFSLDEIGYCLQIGPTSLQETLAQQKAMMQEKRTQLDTVIQAIEETELLIHARDANWDAITHMIQVIQMQQNNDWRNKYFTDEQLQQMEELSKQSYTEEQRQQIAEWGKNWSEADQQVATQQWNEIFADLKRLVASGEEPTGPAAQAFAQRWRAQIEQFTHGHAGITQGLGKMHQSLKKMPSEQRPFQYPYTPEEETFLHAALAHTQNP